MYYILKAVTKRCVSSEPEQKLPEGFLNHKSAVELHIPEWKRAESTKGVGDLSSILDSGIN